MVKLQTPAERRRKGEHELSYGGDGEYVVDQACGAFDHSAAQAARADAPASAWKSNALFMAASGAMKLDETKLEPAALP